MSSRKRRTTPYRSGHCAYLSPGSHGRCAGQAKNGAAVKRTHTLCSCECHGDFEARLVAAGQSLADLNGEEEESDDE